MFVHLNNFNQFERSIESLNINCPIAPTQSYGPFALPLTLQGLVVIARTFADFSNADELYRRNPSIKLLGDITWNFRKLFLNVPAPNDPGLGPTFGAERSSVLSR
jgi:hypothetical protein